MKKTREFHDNESEIISGESELLCRCGTIYNAQSILMSLSPHSLPFHIYGLPHSLCILLLVSAIPEVPEQCAVDIHKSCERTIFDQVVVNHLSWPRTTKRSRCYKNFLEKTECRSPILLNYAKLQEEFGEKLREEEYKLGLYGIFMNDHNKQASIEVL